MVGTKWKRENGNSPVAYPSGAPRRVTLLKLLLLCCISALAVGCPAVVSYQPNERLVVDLGVEQARKRLQETLSRSINPRVIEVQVAQEFVNYRYQQPILGPYGIQVGMTMAENRVHFQNVSRVEVFENNVVFLRAANEVILAQVIFASQEDAKTFADLILSFRAQVHRGAAR
ncbi:MAG TPA: hypothetical protein VLG48_08145 [Candidatus Methylomirabilis sp.]|nr:hypothetical protein [Candidatus Methylomirabilis sp.]